MRERNVDLREVGDGFRGAEDHDSEIWLRNKLVRYVRCQDNFGFDRVSGGLSHYSCTVNRNSQNV